VSPAQTAEPIEIPFGLRARLDSSNDVLDEGADTPLKGAILRDKAEGPAAAGPL